MPAVRARVPPQRRRELEGADVYHMLTKARHRQAEGAALTAGRRSRRPAVSPGYCEPLAMGLDRDVSAAGILARDGFVVEPDPALGQVPEVKCAAGWDGHSRAAGAVRPPPQGMGERIPAVEVTYHRHRPTGRIAGQREGDPHGAVTPRLRSLDQLFLRSCVELPLFEAIISNLRSRCLIWRSTGLGVSRTR